MAGGADRLGREVDTLERGRETRAGGCPPTDGGGRKVWVRQGKREEEGTIYAHAFNTLIVNRAFSGIY